MKLTHLKTNHRIAPMGIDGTPEFSWQMESNTANTVQTAYQITVATDDEIVWDTGIVKSSKQNFVSS